MYLAVLGTCSAVCLHFAHSCTYIHTLKKTGIVFEVTLLNLYSANELPCNNVEQSYIVLVQHYIMATYRMMVYGKSAIVRALKFL